MKTNFKILISLIILQASSCCVSSNYLFDFSVEDIDVNNTYRFRYIGEGITISQEDYRIKCIFSEALIKTINASESTSYSLGFCEDTSLGIQDKIASLTISCNKEIWDTPSGSPLKNDNLSFVHYDNEREESTSYSNPEWVDILNNEEHFTSFEWYIEFNEEIILVEYVQFELLFELINGSLYAIETPTVRFE